MKTALLKHYGKILLTVLALGLGSYFHVDLSKVVDALASTATVSAPVQTGAPDAGK